MSSFSLHIATDNAAFSERPAYEIRKMLRAVEEQLDRQGIDPSDHRQGANAGLIRDHNGNTCGRYFWTDRNQTHDDGAVLDGIAAQLADPEWDAGTIERVAEIAQFSGRDISSEEA